MMQLREVTIVVIACNDDHLVEFVLFGSLNHSREIPEKIQRLSCSISQHSSAGSQSMVLHVDYRCSSALLADSLLL